MKKLFFTILTLAVITVSCKDEGKSKRRGIDYAQLKTELALTDEQSAKYDETVAKYEKLAEENRAAAKASGAKPDRVEMFKQMEERTNRQTEEMAAFLNADQMAKYSDFVNKNGRKRPRYNDQLLAQLKTELALTEDQAKILEASNNAFEKAYHDAHDLYHGNGDLAAQYWNRYDNERKNALKQVLSDEQFAKFNELVAHEGPNATARAEASEKKK